MIGISKPIKHAKSPYAANHSLTQPHTMNNTTRSRFGLLSALLLAVGFVGCQPAMEEAPEAPAMEAPAADSAAMDSAMEAAPMDSAAADSM